MFCIFWGSRILCQNFSCLNWTYLLKKNQYFTPVMNKDCSKNIIHTWQQNTYILMMYVCLFKLLFCLPTVSWGDFYFLCLHIYIYYIIYTLYIYIIYTLYIYIYTILNTDFQTFEHSVDFLWYAQEQTSNHTCVYYVKRLVPI